MQATVSDMTPTEAFIVAAKQLAEALQMKIQTALKTPAEHMLSQMQIALQSPTTSTLSLRVASAPADPMLPRVENLQAASNPLHSKHAVRWLKSPFSW
jgi:hypothetical protein